jgi:hypothetical protein
MKALPTSPSQSGGCGDGPNGWRLWAGALWSQQKIPFCDSKPGAAQAEPRRAPASGQTSPQPGLRCQ